MIEKKIKDNAEIVVKESLKCDRNPREIAMEIAQKKVEKAMRR